MTPEQLLMPRYEVIADYPGSHLEVGKIYKTETGNCSKQMIYVSAHFGNDYAIYVEDYPHLFRKLSWWEKREDNEMPQYVKHPKFGVKKVAAKEYDFRTWHVDDEIEHRFAKTGWGEPATEQEYLNYQNK